MNCTWQKCTAFERMYTPTLCIYVQLATQTDTHSTHPNRTSGLILLCSQVDRDEGLSVDVVHCIYQCTYIVCIPPAAGLRHPVFPAAVPLEPGFPSCWHLGMQAPLHLLVQLPCSQPCTHTDISSRSCHLPTSSIIASAHTLTCAPAFAPVADTAAHVDHGHTPAAAQRPTYTHIRTD